MDKFEPDDMVQINKFRKEFMGEHYCEMSFDEWKLICNQPNFYVLTARDENDNLMGLMLCHRVATLTRKVLRLDDAISAVHGKGIGTGLYKAAVELADKLGVDCVETEFKETTQAIQKICDKLGFINRNNVTYRKWLRSPSSIVADSSSPKS